MGETVRAVTVGGEEMLSCSGYLLKKRARQRAINRNPIRVTP